MVKPRADLRRVKLRPRNGAYNVNGSHRLPASAGGAWLGCARCSNTRRRPLVTLFYSLFWFAFFPSGIGFSCHSQFWAAAPEPFLCPDRSRCGPVHHPIPAISERESSWLECSNAVSPSRVQAHSWIDGKDLGPSS